MLVLILYVLAYLTGMGHFTLTLPYMFRRRLQITNKSHMELCEHDRNSSVGAFMGMAQQTESIVWVRASGDYLSRLSAYNDALSELRIRVLEEIKT